MEFASENDWPLCIPANVDCMVVLPCKVLNWTIWESIS